MYWYIGLFICVLVFIIEGFIAGLYLSNVFDYMKTHEIAYSDPRYGGIQDTRINLLIALAIFIPLITLLLWPITLGLILSSGAYFWISESPKMQKIKKILNEKSE